MDVDVDMEDVLDTCFFKFYHLKLFKAQRNINHYKDLKNIVVMILDLYYYKI